jgi:hypothetical protein
VEWHSKFGNNLHLTHEHLDAVAIGGGEWDTEYASVCNSIFPFDRCATHIGDEGWGAEARSYGDLQVRVYDLLETVEAVQERIAAAGVRDVERLTGHPADVQRSTESGWLRQQLSYDRFYYDYGGTAHVEVRLHRFGDHTIAFVFMYVSEKQDEISTMLKSFEWPEQAAIGKERAP